MLFSSPSMALADYKIIAVKKYIIVFYLRLQPCICICVAFYFKSDKPPVGYGKNICAGIVNGNFLKRSVLSKIIIKIKKKGLPLFQDQALQQPSGIIGLKTDGVQVAVASNYPLKIQVHSLGYKRSRIPIVYRRIFRIILRRTL